MKRTDEQKRAFARKCLEIERANGDVLGYVEVNWPSYTPRATWYNLQRQYLNRNTAQLTEGKPEVPKGEQKEMERRNRMKVVDGLIEAIAKGTHPFDYLEAEGYMSPAQAWADLKIWAKKNAPEKHDQLPPTLKGLKLNRAKIGILKDKHEPAPDLKAGKSLPLKIPEKTGDHISAEDFRKTVEFNGKEYEELEPVKMVNPPWPKEMDKKISDVKAYVEKPSPTCCQPARPSGVTVPDELPEEPNPLKIAALLSSFDPDFRYELSNIKSGKDRVVSLVWREPMGGGERSLNLTAVEWQQFAMEIPRMLRQLGLIK